MCLPKNAVQRLLFPIKKCARDWEQVKDQKQPVKYRDRESVRAFHKNAYLIYLLVCNSTVCVCRTPPRPSPTRHMTVMPKLWDKTPKIPEIERT